MADRIERVRREMVVSMQGNGQPNDVQASHGDLNPQQLDLLFYALRHPGAEFSTTSHQRSQGLDEHTARADLHDLEERGFLVKHQIGLAFVYYPAEDLDKRIGGLA